MSVYPSEQGSIGHGAKAGLAGETGAFHLGYRRWLDGLRGVAILVVLASHFFHLPGGFLGVDIFFVLSGFLITTLLVEEWQRRGSISLKHFYLRRALRLLPAFGILLLLCGLASMLLPSAQERSALRKEMAVAACYVTNWQPWHQIPMPNLGHTWSLSMEEQFYLIWPILLYGMLKLGFTRCRILAVVCAGVLASVSWRIWLYYECHRTPGADKYASFMRMYFGLDTRADALLIGCLAGLIIAWNLLPRSRAFVFQAGAAALLSAVALVYLVCTRHLDNSQLYKGLFTGVALMVAVLIVRLVAAPSRLAAAILEFGPLVGIGRISYALYLYHVPCMKLVRPAGLGWAYPFETLQVVGLSFLAAVTSYYWLERPFLRLKHRLQPLAPAPHASGNIQVSTNQSAGPTTPQQAAA